MPMHSYECECGKRVEDLYFPISDVPHSVECECGKQAGQSWGKGFNHKRSLTDILGPNADHHPQFGTDVKITSPDHYKQLLKDNNMEEAGDPVRGNRNWLKEQNEKNAQPGRPRSAPQYATEEQAREAFGN